MRTLTLLFSIFALVVFLNTEASALYEGQITIKVIDEEGQPLEGVRVGLGFYVGGDKKENAVIGFTDANGLFAGTSKVAVMVGGNASKSDYYESRFHYDFKEVKGGRWLPWNPEVTLILRKIENPVAMYVRDMRMSGSIKIPVVGKEVGFDLIEYDLVAPYGKGKHKDFIIKLDTTVKSQDEYEGILTLTFPNKFDGILLVKEDRRYGSSLKLPRHAPENGYQKKLTKYNKSISGKPYEEDYKQDNNYIFRIRSEEKDGKLVRAMYGKIHGDIRFGIREPGVNFTYYLNPDYTKNLEFDPKQNLFKGVQVGLE